jgi:hypothetical protein
MKTLGTTLWRALWVPCSVCRGFVCGGCGINALCRSQGRVVTLADGLVLCCLLAVIIAQLKEGQGLEATPALLVAFCASLAAIVRKAGEVREGAHPFATILRLTLTSSLLLLTPVLLSHRVAPSWCGYGGAADETLRVRR